MEPKEEINSSLTLPLEDIRGGKLDTKKEAEASFLKEPICN
jgi:hypothetical protein